MGRKFLGIQTVVSGKTRFFRTVYGAILGLMRLKCIYPSRPVTIYRLVAKDTIEGKIVDLHKTKRALAASLLEGTDMAAKMSADDMLQLLQDEWGAQGG